jgi:hypothetical protein
LLLFACETTPDVAHPQSYANDGISFELPRNWTVTEDATKSSGGSENRHLFVESPGSAIVLILVREPPVDQSVEAFAAEFRRKAIEQIDDSAWLESSSASAQPGAGVPVRAVIDGEPRDGVEQAYAVSAAGQVVPHKFRAFKLETSSASAFLVVQAATEDWSRVAPAFDLVLRSFALEADR